MTKRDREEIGRIVEAKIEKVLRRLFSENHVQLSSRPELVLPGAEEMHERIKVAFELDGLAGVKKVCNRAVLLQASKDYKRRMAASQRQSG